MSEERLNVRPLGDRVIVKMHEAQDVTPGGIILPDESKEKPHKGTVVAVGPGKLNPDLIKPGVDPLLTADAREPMSVKKGDVVLFGRYSGMELPGFKDHTIMREDDVLAVVESD